MRHVIRGGHRNQGQTILCTVNYTIILYTVMHNIMFSLEYDKRFLSWTNGVENEWRALVCNTHTNEFVWIT